ncbi:MAG: hypothetical protein ACUZ8H_16055 [Candidatus Anammoxibacter sp.]
MSLVLKTNPVGIDHSINKIQNSIYSYLTNNIGWTNYESYPRAYVNTKAGGTIPENYVGNGEYKEVLFDDTFNVTSYFIADETRSYSNDDGQLLQDVSIVFQGDLKKLYSAILHRADEEMHKDLYDSLVNAVIEDMLTGIVTGVDNVYSDLSLPEDFINRITLDDMSYYHIVKINLSIPFDYCN